MQFFTSLNNRFTKRLAGADARTWVGLVATLGATGLFLALAVGIGEGSTRAFDEWAVRALRNPADPADAIGPWWVEEAARDITALGGVTVLSLVTALAAGYLWMRRAFHAMWLTLAAALGGLILGSALKWTFDRPRPSVVPHLVTARHSSFPSGHSLNAAVVYLTLGLILAEVARRRREKGYFLAVGCLLTGLVGFSRVYLGVHYPTDVLAGWAAGAGWASLCGVVAHGLRRRGSIEDVA